MRRTLLDLLCFAFKCQNYSELLLMALVLLGRVRHTQMQYMHRALNTSSIIGTTAKLLATKLGFGYIDSGAMFRAVNGLFYTRKTKIY